MPTNTSQKKPEKKKDSKELLLELIKGKYGLRSAMVMEETFKAEKKQINEAMVEQGMSADEMGKTQGIDLRKLMSKSTSATPPAEEAPQEFERQGNFLSRPFEVNPQTGQVHPAEILGGLIQSLPAQTQQQLQNLISGQEAAGHGKQPVTPKSQVNTITETQDLLKELGVNATVGATATGVPTISVAPTGGIESLPYEQGIQAYKIARDIAGVRGAPKLLPTVVKGMKAGRTADEIEDELRFSQQSPEFSGTMRNVAQQLTIGQSPRRALRTMDSLDDLLTQGNKEGAKDFMKRMAVEKAGATQKQSIMGQERTTEFLTEIKEDLQALESDGFDTTGFFTGKSDQLLAKVGQLKSPQHMELATKISLAVIQFRRAMTGVQFGMKEHAEYQRLFPGIDKVHGLNMASLDGLTTTFNGNIRKFYQQNMGTENYNKLFGGAGKETSGVEDRYSQYLKIVGGK